MAVYPVSLITTQRLNQVIPSEFAKNCFINLFSINSNLASDILKIGGRLDIVANVNYQGTILGLGIKGDGTNSASAKGISTRTPGLVQFSGKTQFSAFAIIIFHEIAASAAVENIIFRADSSSGDQFALAYFNNGGTQLTLRGLLATNISTGWTASVDRNTGAMPILNVPYIVAMRYNSGALQSGWARLGTNITWFSSFAASGTITTTGGSSSDLYYSILGCKYTGSATASPNNSVVLTAAGDKYLSDSVFDSISKNPWQLFEDPFAAWYYTQVASGASGTVAVTLDNVTSAASGTTTILGSLAQTLAATTSAIAGTTTILGALGLTLADTTLAASGTVGSPVSGSVAETLDDTTLSASGTTTILGTVSLTLANTTLSAAGTTNILGSINATLENTTLSASGSVGGAVAGSISVNLADVTLSASGNTTILGSATVTLENTVLVAQGTTSILGSIGVTLANTTLVATGTSGSTTSGAAYRFLKLWLSKLGV